MKKKVLIALGFVCLVFVAGGSYIIIAIETATSKLDHLITLHQVEIMREQLLIRIKHVQSDLYLMGTRYEKNPNAIIANVDNLKKASGTCFSCHHTATVTKRLNHLNANIEFYSGSIHKILKISGNREELVKESDRAYRTTQNLVAQVDAMVHMANNKLTDKTKASLIDISRSKSTLYVLVVLTPFVAAGFCFVVIREFTKPVKALLEATRKLQSGDLDYRIKGLRDEFGEVATSFNEMSKSLRQTMRKTMESERRYRTLFESAGDAIFIIDAEGDKVGDIVDANPAAAEMHGYSLEELSTLNLIKDLDAPNASQAAPDRVHRILNGEWINAEIDHIKQDGTIFTVEISAGLLEYMGHKYILAIDRDISGRKKMETLVIRSKLEWEETFNTITDMITIHDREFNIVRANKAAEKILGLPFLGVTQAKCYQYYHGKEYPPEYCASCECFDTGKPVSFEMYEPHLDMFLEIRSMPRFDDNDQISGLIHVIRDITEEKKVEASLQRAEQLKMVGEWAASLAHEIKNPLAGIKGSVQVLLEEPGISEEDRSLIAKAVDEIKRIELLIKSLLNFAKPPELQPMLTDLNDLLDKTITFSLKHPALSSSSATPIKVLKEFDSNLPETMIDPMQLQQVLLNLMFNAIEAMPGGGVLAIRTAYDDKLNSIQIAVADSGKGIDQPLFDQIFQPFFTTKRKGSGLGLAITRRLVEQHGGEIIVESKPGQGTVFNVSLKVKKEETELIS
jgi:PAS domain S-box-containing protein